MEINIYLAEGKGKMRKNTGREHRPCNVHLHLLHSFILFLSAPSAADVHTPPYLCTPRHTHRRTHIQAQFQTHINMHSKRGGEREYVQISKLSILFSATIPVGLCSV